MSRSVELWIGIMLVAIGGLVLAADPVQRWFASSGLGGDLWRYWPVVLLVVSVFFVAPALVGRQHRRVRAGMIIPGAVLLGLGAAFLYSSLGDRWGEWRYLWSVVPFSVGVGLYLAGWIADAPALKWIGSGVAAGGVVAFLVFSDLFPGHTFRLVAAIGIILLGLALMRGGLAERLSRKSPA